MESYPPVNPLQVLLFRLVVRPVLCGLWVAGFCFLGVIGHFGNSPWLVDVLLFLVIAVSFNPKFTFPIFVLQLPAAVFAASAYQHFSLVFMVSLLAVWLVCYCVAWYTSHKLKSGHYYVSIMDGRIYKIR